jgi:predicted GNAT family N-acyltransferase
MSKKIMSRTSSTIPFGYDVHPENDHLIIENPKDQNLLAQIRDLENSQSLRSLSKYIEAHTGRKITARGIRTILNRSY